MEQWEELISDFLQEFVEQPAVIVGNSLGSLASLMVRAWPALALFRRQAVALLYVCGAAQPPSRCSSVVGCFWQAAA